MKKVLFGLLLVAMTIQLNAQSADKSGYSIFGYVRTWHQTNFEDNSNEFALKMSRIGIKGNLSDKLSYRLFVDFSRLGKLSSDSETIDGNEVVTDVSATFSNYLLDAYAAFKPVDGLTLQLGQFKIPFSTENLLSAAGIPFVNRSLLRSYGTPGLRDLGFMATYGNKLPLPFKVQFGLFNGSGQNKSENDLTTNYSTRLVLDVVKGLQLSGNYYGGVISGAETSFMDFGAEYNSSGLWAAFEYATRNIELASVDNKSNSYFAYLLYDIDIDSELIPIIQPGFRIETADPDDSIDDNEISRYTFGLNFILTKKKQTHIRVNYEKYDMADGSANPDKLIIEFQIKF